MALATTKNLVYQTNKTIDKMVHDQYKMAPSEWSKIAKVPPTPRGTGFTEAEISGLGPLLTIQQGQQITYDIPTERAPVTRTYTKYGLAFQYTEEMIQDELFGNIKKMANALGKSAGYKPDTAFWDLFNSGFTTHTAWDGNEIFEETSRVLLNDSGTSQNNRPGSDAALSETSLQAAEDYFRTLKDSNGFPIIMRPKYLITAASGAACWAAKVVLNTDKKPGSMNNDINTVNDLGLTHFPSRFITSTTAWFIVAEGADFNLIWKMPMTKNNTDDFATGNFLHSVKMRFMVFCNDPTGCYGTTGA